MAKIRINDLARELEVKSRMILEYLASLGITDKRSHSSPIDNELADKVREHFRALAQEGKTHERAPTVATAQTKAVVLPSGIESPVTIRLPERFTFYQSGGVVNFDRALRIFDWSVSNRAVTIDLTFCLQANFQALSLLIPYLWKLTASGCTITVKYGGTARGASSMYESMGAAAWKETLLTDDSDFEQSVGARNRRKMLYALRQRSDVKNAINRTRSVIGTYDIEFPDYLSYIVSELLYNATEHGRCRFMLDGRPVYIPAILEFGYYSQVSRLRFIFIDVGMGIKAHLEQTYPAYANHYEAIIHSLQPNVSGTFGQSMPYGVKDNAGMGLTYSSRMLKRLKADMYIISYDGLVHVSPEDITSRRLRNAWPGTFVLVDLDLRGSPKTDLEGLLDEIRKKANEEVSKLSAEEENRRFCLSMFNFFGRFAEDKDAAIHFRDKYLLPAIEEGKTIEIDFRGVETAPHSFLSALLATPIQRIGMRAYKRIKPLNASGSIRQVFDGIMDANTPKV
jgi:hypothetical protein